MSSQLLHDILITLHAASGVVAFIAGCFLILSLAQISNERLFSLYWWPLVGLVVFLAGAMLVYWTEYSGIERIIFPGLLGLGLFMLYRARSANRLLRAQSNHWKYDYVEHIGFTLISLFEGFIIVSGLNSGLSGWLVALLAVLGVLVGRWVIGLAQRRVEIEPSIVLKQ